MSDTNAVSCLTEELLEIALLQKHHVVYRPAAKVLVNNYHVRYESVVEDADAVTDAVIDHFINLVTLTADAAKAGQIQPSTDYSTALKILQFALAECGNLAKTEAAMIMARKLADAMNDYCHTLEKL